jgi:hypothetical protein
MNKCATDAGVTEDAPIPTTNAEICSMTQKGFSCYPKCVCDDATFKEEFEMMAAFISAMADCTDLKCGAAGLRASVLTSILAALSVAIFAAK